MQLIAPRLRIALIAIIWFIAMAALVLWLGSSRVQRVAIAGGPAGSETLVLIGFIVQVAAVFAYDGTPRWTGIGEI